MRSEGGKHWKMNIGEAAKASGVSAKMIRYYEDIGIVPPIQRTSSGYRNYSDPDIRRLRFIRRARDLGFSIAEIRDLLKLWANEKRESADVKRIAQQHVSELQRRIESMTQMANTLNDLISRCAGSKQPECPILNSLEAMDDAMRGNEKSNTDRLPSTFGKGRQVEKLPNHRKR